MNEKFLELPKEKQLKIINAGMEYFGKYGYKSASTDDIAARAEISKGLLFYYFHNKKSFYLYLYDYCAELMLDYINSSRIQEITDFFDIMDCGAALKMRMIVDYPYLMDKQRTQQDISVEDMLVDFNSWKNMFKKMCYKEEYL